MLDEFISGGISGAIVDPESERGKEHAERFYEEIRNNKSHSDVKKIAENTGYSFEQILQIKNYLFVDEHLLDEGVKRFTPSFEIAQSWQRLAYDFENVKNHDFTLLKHELREMALVNQGYSQSEAHRITERDYNYRIESIEYYISLGFDPHAMLKESQKSKNSGAIRHHKQKDNWEERY